MKNRQAEGIPTKLAGDGKFDSRGKFPTQNCTSKVRAWLIVTQIAFSSYFADQYFIAMAYV